ncbi:MAG: hypothetical protein IPO92_18735 [Saprospiraceae bacterium]|nr:hypothetical protein [Saprospiraceae bacterium]
MWETDAPTDVEMNGIGSFANSGTLSNCGTTSINTIFNIGVNNSGTIKGIGGFLFNGSLVNTGWLNPGCSPGHLEFHGNTTAGSGLNIEVNGTAPELHDHLLIHGTMVASGILNIAVAGIKPGRRNGNHKKHRRNVW